MVKCDLKMMFVDVLEWNQIHSDKIWRYQIWSTVILVFFKKGWPLILSQNFKFVKTLYMVKCDLKNDVSWCFRVKSKSFLKNMRISNLIGRHFGFFPKELAYDFGSKCQISLKFVNGQIDPGNDVWWCFKVTSKWFWPYMTMSNLHSRHLGFFPKGLAFDFGSKFQISLNFVYGRIEPGNDVCWCFNVKSKWFWQNMNMSNLISRHLGFFPKGLAYDFGSKFQISSEFLYSEIGPRNHVCWCFRVKLKRF